MTPLDATHVSMYLAGVLLLTEMIKFSKYVPDRHGMAIAAIVSAFAVGLHILQYGYTQTELMNYFFGWVNILAGAAGVYGFVREVRSGDVYNASRTIAPLLILALLVGCGKPVSTTTPDRAVAQAATYGKQAVDLITIAQTTVNDYARAQGGRTAETDAVSVAVRDRVIPAAERVRRALNTYAVASEVAKAAAQNDLQVAVDQYVAIVEEVFKDKVPAGLASNLVQTVYNVRSLATTIRMAYLQSRTSQSMSLRPVEVS